MGYEDQAGSIITVKVYDADCGRALFDDAYELIVKDDQGGQAAGWTARIFAGGPESKRSIGRASFCTPMTQRRKHFDGSADCILISRNPTAVMQTMLLCQYRGVQA